MQPLAFWFNAMMAAGATVKPTKTDPLLACQSGISQSSRVVSGEYLKLHPAQGPYVWHLEDTNHGHQSFNNCTDRVKNWNSVSSLQVVRDMLPLLPCLFISSHHKASPSSLLPAV
ncbi:hypothetical protein BS47DRAFT_145282 [Hydnum rufescens UP504]|uniref:Uncharacterized protein n=1 Tax=Hydnum rufescens UP504 TaxID=1448309 RepID=A0A9P6ARG7_9AGAM|nr:hypothetical protein BS47DRAFT_145282 [Hydnum rufescens UP504]